MHERDIDAYDNEMYSGHPDIPTEMWVFYAFPPEIRKQIGKEQHWACVMCGHSYQDGYMVEIDHIVPEAEAKRRGWTESQIQDKSNGQVLCLPCHEKKHLGIGDYAGAAYIRGRMNTSGIYHHGYKKHNP